jgi:hypothetical protein
MQRGLITIMFCALFGALFCALMHAALAQPALPAAPPLPGPLLRPSPAAEVWHSLATSSQVKSQCPGLVGAAIGDPDDRATWTPLFNPGQTPSAACDDAARAVINAFVAPKAKSQ